MIFSIVRISALRLWHNKAELLLTFVVPLIFFSIFAWIFGSRDSDGGTPRIKIVIADAIKSEQSQFVIDTLCETRSLRILNASDAKSNPQGESADTHAELDAMNTTTAATWVRNGKVSAAVILKSDSENDQQIKAEVWADSFDQVASQILGAVVQKALIGSQQRLRKKAIAEIQQTTQTAVYDTSLPSPGVVAASNTENLPTSVSLELPTIEIRDVLGENKANPVIAMYAAGIAVMFSLFSTTTASGSLLEERENSTLERLLCSRLTIDQLLMGKWLYLSGLGFIQICLMFLWGNLAFGVDLFNHLNGFFLMTLATSAAAASFALLIATCCTSRVQLGWLSTIVILVMSALGGSMVPRYLMSESVQRVGFFTFNAWALEGYNKVFWRDQSVQSLATELGVLIGSAFLMLTISRAMIARWERC